MKWPLLTRRRHEAELLPLQRQNDYLRAMLARTSEQLNALRKAHAQIHPRLAAGPDVARVRGRSRE